MKQRPIIFSAPMVPPILADKKTQTRRVVKVQPTCLPLPKNAPDALNCALGAFVWNEMQLPPESILKLCPYGIVGDQLWGREPWRIGAWNEHGQFIIEYSDGSRSDWLSDPDDVDGEKFNNIVMQCSDELNNKGIQPDADGQYHWPDGESPLRWRSSMFMPRWASRILLEVTNTLIERVQDISQQDAIAEGAPPSHPSINCVSRELGFSDFSRSWFGQHWDRINGKKHPWSDNPWVWVIEFKRIEVSV